MDKELKSILFYLELLLGEYSEAKFYIYNGIRVMVTDLLNSIDCLEELDLPERR